MLALVLLPPTEVQTVLARADAWLSRNRQFEVRANFSTSALPKIPLTMRIDRPGRVFFRTRAAEETFSMLMTTKGRVDLNSRERMYDDQVPPGPSFFPSRVSGLPALVLPGFLMRPGFSDVVPPRAESKILRRTAAFDEIQADLKETLGTYSVTTSIAKDGRVLALRVVVTGGGGSSDRRWTDIQMTPRKWRDADFSLPIPDDYTPFALNETTGPRGQGSTFKLPEPVLGQAKSGVAMVVLLDDSAPSRKLRADLNQLAFGVKPTVYDLGSGQTLITQLEPPAYPFVVLFDREAKSRRYWMGYDPDAAREWALEIKTATEALRASK
ncbi:MAG: hypothetical protein SFX74_10655 [Fimbriimonadaceae bacterium]|nr:hypothetical protein [Fimbriimonadaceae bacterium]